MTPLKIIVLDDDPTGSQTVHSCLLATRWDLETLRAGLDDASPLFFVLTNTRGLEPEAAAKLTREVCANLRQLLADYDRPTLFVSRSDSTLRGHYPVETDVMNEILGPFDAHFLVPAFLEGGRVTIDGTHYVREADRLVPADQTEFARDTVFGYSTSYLPDYVQEKTGARIGSKDVLVLPARESAEPHTAVLATLGDYRCVAVDASEPQHLQAFAKAIRMAAANGKRFLFRSAAGLLSALADLPPQPVYAFAMGSFTRRRDGKPLPGCIVVGSHVRKTTEQLSILLEEPGVVPVEVDVGSLDPGADVENGSDLPADAVSIVEASARRVTEAIGSGSCPVVFTSRQERVFEQKAARMRFGSLVSRVLVEIVRRLPQETGFLVSKGGITSNDILSDGLALPLYRVLGQVIAGCTVVRTPAHHRIPDLPVVVFPGNVGGPGALLSVYRCFHCGGEAEGTAL